MNNKQGWSFLFNDYVPPINYINEVYNRLIRIIIDLVSSIPFFLILIGFLIFSNRSKNIKIKKILFGTVPVISFNLINKLLIKNNIDSTLFVFDDWSKGNHHEGICFKDICKIKFINSNPYNFGPYIAFLWGIKNFDIFCLYFNGGFLERTIFWKLEPIIYQLLNKKVILIPYGSDVWTMKHNNNRMQKLGHLMSSKRYFILDGKRESRIFHWSKYVNLIIATINYIDFLPRIDILVYHGHIIEDINNYQYTFKETNKIKILHYANEGVRKGSLYIEDILQNSTHNYNIEFYYGEKRSYVLSKLENAHIYIEQITDGFFSYSALEAMLQGKIIFAYLDEEINKMYKILDSKYYINFFNNLPIVNVNDTNIKEKIEEYTNKDFKDLKKISLKTREFAIKLINENEKIYLKIFRDLSEK